VENLTRKALAAYYRWGGLEWFDDTSGPIEIDGKIHVVLRRAGNPHVVYPVRNDGMLKKLRRWPHVLMREK